MKHLILAILAAVLAVGTVGATVHALSLAELQQEFAVAVEDSTDIRVQTQGYAWKGAKSPDAVIMIGDGVTAHFEYRSHSELRLITVRVDGEVVQIVPEIDGDGLDNRTGYVYFVDAVFGLGPIPTVIVGRVLQDNWYWPNCFWEGCNPDGTGPFPPGDERGWGSFEPHSLSPHLFGCHLLQYDQDMGLSCLDPGWTPPE